MLGTVRCHDLAQQKGAAIAQLRDEVSELMTGIGHGKWLGTLGDTITGEDGGALRRAQRRVRQPECIAQRMIENNQCRIRHGRGRGPDVKVRAQVNVRVVEGYRFQWFLMAGLYESVSTECDTGASSNVQFFHNRMGQARLIDKMAPH